MAQPPILSDELRRTLGFFGGEDWAAPPTTFDLDLVVKRHKGTRASDPIFVWNPVKHGNALFLLPNAVDLLATKLQVEISHLLSVSHIQPRTFYRRQAEVKPLSPTESDRVMRIARVASLAQRVFGDEQKAIRWLTKDSRVLGAKPLEMLATDLGTHEVEAELNRIDMGDFG